MCHSKDDNVGCNHTLLGASPFEFSETYICIEMHRNILVVCFLNFSVRVHVCVCTQSSSAIFIWAQKHSVVVWNLPPSPTSALDLPSWAGDFCFHPTSLLSGYGVFCDWPGPRWQPFHKWKGHPYEQPLVSQNHTCAQWALLATAATFSWSNFFRKAVLHMYKFIN